MCKNATAFIQCFNAVGYMTGRSSDQEKSVPFITKGSIPVQVEEENWLIQVHLENGY